MSILRRLLYFMMCCVPLAVTPVAYGQFVGVTWTGAVDNEWTDTGNWDHPDGAFIPDGQFNEVAFVTNGGTAQVTSNVSSGPGDLVVNSGSTVEITNAGTLTLVEPATGTEVQRSVFLGDGTLTFQGNATLNTGGFFLDPTGQTNFELSDSTNSTVNVAEFANLNGNFNIDYSGLTTSPVGGETFTLIDSVGDLNDFGVTITSEGLSPGQVTLFEIVPGGSGNQFRTTVQNQLVLEIDRDTDIATIRNLSPGSITIDGFAIQSALGGIDSSSFTSLGAGWTVSPTGTSTIVSQLNESSSLTLGPGNSAAVGAIHDPLAPSFNIELEDYAFTYTGPAGAIDAAVQYVGTKVHNTVVLKVNPTTGEAAVINESVFGQDLEAFTITSASGSLDSAGATAATGDWTVAGSSDSSRITQLQEDGTTLFNNTSLFDIGTIFTGGGTQDLVFEFLLAGTTTLTQGVVVYGDIVAPLPGDFNTDGQVDGDDLTDTTEGWQDRFGSDLFGSDFLTWQRNLGSGVPLGAAVTAVPEVASLWLMVLGLPFLAFRRKTLAFQAIR